MIVKALGAPNDISNVRQIARNILDWGCNQQFEDNKKICDRIFEYERKRHAGTAESDDNDDDGGRGSSAKKRKHGR